MKKTKTAKKAKQTTLADAKLGDRVNLWITQSMGVSNKKTKYGTLEATIIGIGKDCYWEEGDPIEYVLGWKLDQVYRNGDDMTVLLPEELEGFDWVSNRLDYAWYSADYDATFECEILPAKAGGEDLDEDFPSYEPLGSVEDEPCAVDPAVAQSIVLEGEERQKTIDALSWMSKLPLGQKIDVLASMADELCEVAPEGYWRKKDGDIIPIDEMSDDHLNNTIAMLERKGWTKENRHKMAELVAERSNRTGIPSKQEDIGAKLDRIIELLEKRREPSFVGCTIEGGIFIGQDGLMEPNKGKEQDTSIEPSLNGDVSKHPDSSELEVCGAKDFSKYRGRDDEEAIDWLLTHANVTIADIDHLIETGADLIALKRKVNSEEPTSPTAIEVAEDTRSKEPKEKNNALAYLAGITIASGIASALGKRSVARELVPAVRVPTDTTEPAIEPTTDLTTESQPMETTNGTSN